MAADAEAAGIANAAIFSASLHHDTKKSRPAVAGRPERAGA